eukprot:CAMPEP_0169170648 /NCGR_PEP_ID=MMETSP1015-20121227/62276_1 /TAXON_ID=342587 /ORGANISM="Karlodinium micrum, Strain CCMP2283" /LENGTH=80 /DNA_ID=CAMNT_0009243757 /DNA_START=186 /DNA_END=428 /DNA_ORIENTATION=-
MNSSESTSLGGLHGDSTGAAVELRLIPPRSCQGGANPGAASRAEPKYGLSLLVTNADGFRTSGPKDNSTSLASAMGAFFK